MRKPFYFTIVNLIMLFLITKGAMMDLSWSAGESKKSVPVHIAEELEADQAKVLPSVPIVTHMPVLMYHKIDDNGTPNTAVITSEVFREHMEALNEAGYQTISEEDLVTYVRHGGLLVEKPILITFDDGYLDNYEQAFPILKEFGMKASMYVIFSYRGQKPGRNVHFDWEQAREMIASGHIGFRGCSRVV